MSKLHSKKTSKNQTTNTPTYDEMIKLVMDKNGQLNLGHPMCLRYQMTAAMMAVKAVQDITKNIPKTDGKKPEIRTKVEEVFIEGILIVLTLPDGKKTGVMIEGASLTKTVKLAFKVTFPSTFKIPSISTSPVAQRSFVKILS